MSLRTSMLLAVAGFALATTPALAATFGELSGAAGNGGNGAMTPNYPSNGFPSGAYAPNQMPGYPSGAYAPAPMSCPPYCSAQPQGFGGPEGVSPDSFSGSLTPYDIPTPMMAPRLYMPMQGNGDLPHNQLNLWTFGQMNSTTDPFNPYGLSTPDMFVPWSTPLSGWANAQTWNWWRERSGALPRNW